MPSETNRAKGSPWIERALLVATSLLVLLLSVGWWSSVPPLGHDASGHIALFARVSEALSTGARWWAPDYNFGFPIGHYYQPLPHAVGGILTWLAGGGPAAVGVYKWVTVALVALSPWSVWLGARRAGLPATAALVAGLAAPLIVSTLDFGLTAHSSLVLGLHAQAWAGVTLPLAAGEVLRVVRGLPGSRATAVLAWAALFSSHFFYGAALVAWAGVWCLASHPREWRARFWRLGTVGLALTVMLAFWLVPLLTTLPSMGGWPFGNETRINGYGLSGFLEPLLAGALLDGEGSLPRLSALAFAGLVVAVSRFRHDETARCLAFATVLAGAFTIGRAGLGPIVDLFPLNRGVQMFRYLGLFHLAALWCVGYGAATLLSAMNRRPTRWAALAVLSIVWLLAVGRGGNQLVTGFQTIDKSDFDLAQYELLTEEMRRESRANGAARTYAFWKSGVPGHYHSGLLALWDVGEMGESQGVGLHDGLGFYFLEFFQPDPPRRPDRDNLALLDLYDFQYIVSSREHNYEALGAVPTFAQPNYTYWRLPTRSAICTPFHIDERYTAYPREVREQARRWLDSDGPRRHIQPLIEVPNTLSMGGVTAGPVEVVGGYPLPDVEGEAGRVHSSQRAADRVACDVTMDRAGGLLFKIGHHPYWRLEVDGRPTPTYLTYPSYLATELEPGRHVVVARFEPPPVRGWLVLLVPLPVAVLTWRDRRGVDGS